MAWDNAGRYTARASNSHGQAETECKVKLTTKSQRELSAKRSFSISYLRVIVIFVRHVGLNHIIGVKELKLWSTAVAIDVYLTTCISHYDTLWREFFLMN